MIDISLRADNMRIIDIAHRQKGLRESAHGPREQYEMMSYM